MNKIKYSYYIWLLLVFNKILIVSAQENNTWYVQPEIGFGKTMPANMDFPEVNMFSSVFVSFGKKHSGTSQWSKHLGNPKTGLLAGFANYGNSDQVGRSYSLLPFAEFSLKPNRLFTQIAFGASYFDTKYYPKSNPNNQAISTSINWSFRAMLYYQLPVASSYNWRLGIGYFHQSNGHTRLPNYGLNTFMGSLSGIIPYKQEQEKRERLQTKALLNSNYFLSFRYGLGINAFSERSGEENFPLLDSLNSQQPVHTLAFTFGKQHKSFLKYGIGGYYRFYQHYYDYIEAGNDLMLQNPELNDAPFLNASTFGIHASGELLLGQVGFEVQIGANFHKPFYKIDWQINQGYYYTNEYEDGPITFRVLGELTSYYKIKKIISSRMGLKYYFFSPCTSRNNIYVAAHINANLGQADFSEISFGYVCNWL